MSKSDFLKKYHKKRDFDRTAEPFGGDRYRSGGRIFVVQKHDAFRLHYDFRIEIDGVLKSWAVPRGPSLNPKEKRLAVATEDHPMKYADFEGVIPKGQYGGGTVMIWDAGTFRNLKEEHGNRSETMEQAYKDGEITIWLEGKKLKGGLALIKTGKRGSNQWLLIKMNDRMGTAAVILPAYNLNRYSQEEH